MILTSRSLNVLHAVGITIPLANIVCLNSAHPKTMILMLMSVVLVILVLSSRKINVSLITVLSSLLSIKHFQTVKNAELDIAFKQGYALPITVQLIHLAPSNVRNASKDSISSRKSV